jgi:hypothetical protein
MIYEFVGAPSRGSTLELVFVIGLLTSISVGGLALGISRATPGNFGERHRRF